MPRLRNETHTRRRLAILSGAWRCFARDGFQASSVQDVAAECGLATSTVYRYFRSKEDLVEATAERGLLLVRGLLARVATRHPVPRPQQLLALIADELRSRAGHPAHDFTAIAVTSWAETARHPRIRRHTRALHSEITAHLAELAEQWKSVGHLPPDADAAAVATALSVLMQGMVISHHLHEPRSSAHLDRGLAALANRAQSPPTVPSTPTGDRALKLPEGGTFGPRRDGAAGSYRVGCRVGANAEPRAVRPRPSRFVGTSVAR